MGGASEEQHQHHVRSHVPDCRCTGSRWMGGACAVRTRDATACLCSDEPASASPKLCNSQNELNQGDGRNRRQAGFGDSAPGSLAEASEMTPQREARGYGLK